MLLTPNEHLTIILSSIRDYQPGENDIPILIVQKISKQLIESVDNQITTQDIYDEVDLEKIDDGFYELVKTYLNMIVEEYNGINKST